MKKWEIRMRGSQLFAWGPFGVEGGKVFVDWAAWGGVVPGNAEALPALMAAGVPGFNPIQDYGNYDIRTHHTNMDTYDHVLEDDLRQSAAVAASVVYDLSMRDERVPRKPLPSP